MMDVMEAADAILLGTIQGLTEFLPVSSSGHLVLAGEILGVDPESWPNYLAFEVLLHLGSLCAIATVFAKDLARLVYPRIDFQSLGLLFVASLPAAVVGITIKKLLPHAQQAWLESNVISSPMVAACGLLVTSCILWVGSAPGSERFSFAGEQRGKVWSALLVGCAQAIAILPGISRSGSTIATALRTGWVKPEAVKLSFLMGFIAIGGAGLIEAKNIGALANANAAPMIAGFAASLLSSLAGLLLVRLIVKKGKLRWFAAYCALAGMASLVWLLVR